MPQIRTAHALAQALRSFQVGDKVTDGLIRGTVTQLDPVRGMVGVEFWPWPSERRWDWFSEDRLRLERPVQVRP